MMDDELRSHRSMPVTKEQFNSMFDQSGRLVHEHELRKCIFKGNLHVCSQLSTSSKFSFVVSFVFIHVFLAPEKHFYMHYFLFTYYSLCEGAIIMLRR